MENNVIPGVKKIAVVRANALGDFIVTLPALAAVKETYPHVELVLLGKPWHKVFLEGRKSPVDRVVVVPVLPGVRDETGESASEEELARFFEEMRAEEFDIAMHFQGDGRSLNSFVRNLGARLCVGLSSPGALDLDRSLPFVYYQSEVIRYLEVVALIGAQTSFLDPVIGVREEDLTAARAVFPQLDEQYIVLHCGAHDLRRMWSVEKFAAVGDALMDKGFLVVLTGDTHESVIIDAVRGQMCHTPIVLMGKLSLGGLCGVLSRAALVVSNDTGPLHLARAVGALTIGLYWAPNVINWGPLTRTKHRIAVSWDMVCPVCGIVPNNPYPFEPQFNCTHTVSFISSITVEEVVTCCLELLR
jgi:ADP-heptose:LPS heptosyltransferase